MWNETDYDRAMNKIAALEAEELNKAAFVAMGPNAPQPAPPPMDPAMAGGGAPVDPATGMPMDPAMMGGGAPMDPAMAGGGMPMDPAMAGGAPMDPAMGGAPMDPAMMGGAPVDPAMAGAPPADAGADPYDMIVQAVRQVMQEMGVTGDGDGEKEKPKKKEGTSSKIEKLEAMLGTIMTTLGLPIPEGEESGSEGGGDESKGEEANAADAQAAGFGMESGMPSEAPPMAAGPLDPNASMAMANLDPGGMPQPAQPPKMAGFRPLDDLSEVRRMAETIKRIRATR